MDDRLIEYIGVKIVALYIFEYNLENEQKKPHIISVVYCGKYGLLIAANLVLTIEIT
jgi:hypothetical protein